MKQILNISIMIFTLLAISTIQAQSQHNISLNFGRKDAANNMYLQKGHNLELGYQFDFGKNYFLKTSINSFLIKENPEYSLINETSIDQTYSYMFPFTEGLNIVFANGINVNFGLTFCEEKKLQPLFSLGLSGYYLQHYYYTLIVDQRNMTDKKVYQNQFNPAFQMSSGLIFRITDHIKLQTTGTLQTLPFAKIGIQEKKLTTLEINAGIMYSF